MINAVKAMQLDMLMGKQYAKTFFICIAGAVAFTVVSRVFPMGIFFAMLLAATGCCYPFATEETCGGERLYGMLPLKRGQAVAGRYLYAIILGAGTILISTALSAAAYSIAGFGLNTGEICIGVAMSVVMFAISIACQLPGYYKYGSTKGRAFNFIPMVLYFGGFALVNKVGIDRVQGVLENLGTAGILAIAAAFVVLIISVSAAASVRIYTRRGM